MNLSNGRASTAGLLPSGTSLVAKLETFLESIARRNWKGQIFYHEDDIRQWMLEDTSLDPNKSTHNLDFLWRQSYVHQFRHMNIDANRIAQEALLVFTMLHCLNNGQAIETFLRHRMDDNKMLVTSGPLESDLRHLGPDDLSGISVEEFIERFEELRWSFFPARIAYYMDVAYVGSRFILPFVTCETVNTKGGTANVHRCEIQQDLIEPSSELHNALRDSLHETEEWGQVGPHLSVLLCAMNMKRLIYFHSATT